MQKDEEFFLTDEIISELKKEIPLEEYESFLKKIKENNPDALFNLSVICQYTGCSSDEFWIDVLQEAADLGSEEAKEQLADLCNIDSEEKKLPFSKRKKEWGLYKELAEDGNYRGLFGAGCYYLVPDNPEFNPAVGIKYLEKVGDNKKEYAGEVGVIFEELGDFDRAIKYYKKARTYEDELNLVGGSYIDEEGIQTLYYGAIANAYFEKGDIPNAIKYAEKGIADEKDSHCYYLLGKIYLQNEEWDKAIQYFKESQTEEGFRELGLFYADSKDAKDKETALYYFKKASNKYDCSYFIESLENELETPKEDEFAIHIDNVIDDAIPCIKYPKIAEEELKKDFGLYWNRLSDFTRTVLISGIASLFYFEKCEKQNPNLRLDYSGVISSVSRALEKETKEYFFAKFRNYLIKMRINPISFNHLKGFIQKNDSRDGYSYTYTKVDHWYTLGKLERIVNKCERTQESGETVYTIDKYLLNYCDSVLFKKNSFSKSNAKRRIDISKYMISLGEQTANIASDYRNVAAHSESTSNAEKARECVKWVIKVKKILLELVEKIDFSKIQEL